MGKIGKVVVPAVDGGCRLLLEVVVVVVVVVVVRVVALVSAVELMKPRVFSSFCRKNFCFWCCCRRRRCCC